MQDPLSKPSTSSEASGLRVGDGILIMVLVIGRLLYWMAVHIRFYLRYCLLEHMD